MTLPSRFMRELEPVLGKEVCSPYDEYTRRDLGLFGRSSYAGYGARRSFSRRTDADEDEFGYQSDLPAQSGTASFRASAGYERTKSVGTYAGNPSQKDYAAFRTGVKIHHPKFGDGLIISTRGEGAAKIANVSFPGLGIKSLSVQIAPITIIQ